MIISKVIRPIRLVRFSHTAAAQSADAPLIERSDVPCKSGGGFIRVLKLNSPRNRNAISLRMQSALEEEIRQSAKWANAARGYLVANAGQMKSARERTGFPSPPSVNTAPADPDEKQADVKKEVTFGMSESPHKPIRALVISSAIDGIFCAGADLKEREKMSLEETGNFLKSLRRTLNILESLPIPTIAAVSGFALGGGFEMALAAAMRVFSQSATIGLPETSLGIIPGAGGIYRLRETVGKARATEIILSGRRVGAKEASNLQICQLLVESRPNQGERESTIDAAVELAQRTTAGAPLASIAASTVLRYDERKIANSSSKSYYHLVARTEDRDRALKAFKEKKLPIFEGN